ncbi:hypothetical protein [Bradyrhizobium sp. CCBAU 11434]|uniref:hypothetical protein n=1 Tax=Bradyrhizobium sp. CCBAU 11434 TaxID=1630885 RepID=UPI002306423B|nr:hypothetical protein [Bradyrhizobium sp. CCBAU 11434]
MASSRHKDRTEPDGRPLKITLGDLRSTGVRDLIVFCQDYQCSHNVKLAAEYVDRWPDEIRISQLEPRFVCKACGMRGPASSAAATALSRPFCREKTERLDELRIAYRAQPMGADQ